MVGMDGGGRGAFDVPLSVDFSDVMRSIAYDIVGAAVQYVLVLFVRVRMWFTIAVRYVVVC